MKSILLFLITVAAHLSLTRRSTLIMPEDKNDGDTRLAPCESTGLACAAMDPEPAPLSPLEQHTRPVAKHSGLGIAAFVIALAAGLMLFLSFAVAGYLHMHNPEGPNSGMVALVGLVIIGLCLVHLLGIVLAIGALFQADRRKMFSVLGLALNAFALAATVGLILLGRAMK